MFLVRRARWRPSSADLSQPSAFCFQREAARHPDRQPRSVNDWRDFTAPMAQQKSYHLSLTRMRESVGRDRMLRLVPCIQLPSVAIGVRRSVRAKSAAKAAWKQWKQTENKQRDQSCDDVSETVTGTFDMCSVLLLTTKSDFCTDQLLHTRTWPLVFNKVDQNSQIKALLEPLSGVWWSCSDSGGWECLRTQTVCAEH